jgi:hypothetical protein
VLPRPLRIRAQRERDANHSQPFGRFEVVAGAVESSQVPRPQLFERFAPAAGDGGERLGSSAPFRGRISALRDRIDQGVQLVATELFNVVSWLFDG